MSSPFSKIITGEISSYKLYEDEYSYAFLNIYPHASGHTIIVPKIEVDHFSDVPEPYYSAIWLTAKKLSPLLQKVTHCTRVCAIFSGFEIPHCHLHLIPSNDAHDLEFSHAKPAPPDELSAMQEQILAELTKQHVMCHSEQSEESMPRVHRT